MSRYGVQRLPASPERQVSNWAIETFGIVYCSVSGIFAKLLMVGMFDNLIEARPLKRHISLDSARGE